MKLARVLVERWMGGESLTVKWGVSEDDGSALRVPVESAGFAWPEGFAVQGDLPRQDELVRGRIPGRVSRGGEPQRA